MNCFWCCFRLRLTYPGWDLVFMFWYCWLACFDLFLWCFRWVKLFGYGGYCDLLFCIFLDGFLDCWMVFDYGSECLLMLFIQSWVLVVVYLFCLFGNGFVFCGGFAGYWLVIYFIYGGFGLWFGLCLFLVTWFRLVLLVWVFACLFCELITVVFDLVLWMYLVCLGCWLWLIVACCFVLVAFRLLLVWLLFGCG